MLDYIIVGLGLAGVSFCEQLEKNGKTFTVISDESQSSSLVAGGLYNPVILKRFTLAWKAKEQLELAIPFYTELEKKLGVKLNHSLPVYRRFASIEEQNLWFEAMDKKGLDEFLSSKIHPNTNPYINAPQGYGQVLGIGRIDVKKLVTSYKRYLQERGRFQHGRFNYDRLQLGAGKIQYGSPEGGETLWARQLVFTEGFGMKKNPYFNYLPLQGSKGEYVFIKAPKLKEERAIKSSVFVIPEGDDLYRVGANYAPNDKTNEPTEAAKDGLLAKLETFFQCDYEVVDQVAGVRPTVSDRRPLVGRHPEHQNLYVLNGFGSRGVMTGPYVARQLFEHISDGRVLDEEIDISRFESKHFKKRTD